MKLTAAQRRVVEKMLKRRHTCDDLDVGTIKVRYDAIWRPRQLIAAWREGEEIGIRMFTSLLHMGLLSIVDEGLRSAHYQIEPANRALVEEMMGGQDGQ